VTEKIGHEVIENRLQILIGRSTIGSNSIRAELIGGPAGYLPGASTYKERQDVTRKIGNTMLVHSGFLHAKELLRKLSAVLTYTLKIVRQLFLGRRSLKNIGLKGTKLRVLACPGRSFYTITLDT
jgi:hypothetical protein